MVGLGTLVFVTVGEPEADNVLTNVLVAVLEIVFVSVLRAEVLVDGKNDFVTVP